MANIFKLYPTHFSRGAKKFLGGLRPRSAPPGYGSDNRSCTTLNIYFRQGCGAGVVRSWRFLDGVGFLTTLGAGVGIFVRLRLRMYNWIIFYITP